MIGKILQPVLRRFGYDLIPFPTRGWHLRQHSLRAGVSEVLDSMQINCVIDVGANYGQYGEFLRQIGYKGRIVSFEPVAKSFDLLAERAKSDPAWQVHRLAAGSANQPVEMNVMDSDQFSSLLPMNSYGRSRYPAQTVVTRVEQVNVVRLDSMMDEVTAGLDNPRVYLKMDTQGYDLQVLEGASGCLPLVFGLQSEIALRPLYEGMPNYLISLAQLNALGFVITSVVPVSRDENFHVIEFDCLMSRNS